MAITNALITGKVVIPGTTIGVRAEITATPMTQNAALKWVADGTVSWGPASVETGNNGVIPAPGLAIPLGSSVGSGLAWRFVARPIDRKDLKPWVMGMFAVTGSANLASLVSVELITYTPAQVAAFESLVADAEAAKVAAEADAAAAAASATAADGWAEAAASSAADADSSADLAAVSETTAVSAASTATTQAGNASTSATSATGSAATATTKAADAETARAAAVVARTGAETARTGAETAETNAEGHRTAVEAVVATSAGVMAAVDADPDSDFRQQQDLRLSATIVTAAEDGSVETLRLTNDADALVITDTLGTNGRRIRIAPHDQATSTASAQVEILPGANCPTAGEVPAQLLIYGKTGDDYERFEMSAYDGEFLFASTEDGAGVLRPIVTYVGTDIATQAVPGGHFRIHHDLQFGASGSDKIYQLVDGVLRTDAQLLVDGDFRARADTAYEVRLGNVGGFTAAAICFGSGQDTTIYRADVNYLVTSGSLRIGADLKVVGKVGFYNTNPVAKQTGVTVDAAGIHAALVNLGLISA